MQRLPPWLWPLPAWLWPRNVSATPNGLQRLGRVLHWSLSGLALFLKGLGILVAAGALFAVVRSASWEITGLPVPKDLKWVEVTLVTPFNSKPRFDSQDSLTDDQLRAEIAEFARRALNDGSVPQDRIGSVERIAREAAASDWKVTRKSTDSTRAKERSLTKARARIELQRALAALPSAISTALGLMLGALASALVGRASRYVISGE